MIPSRSSARSVGLLFGVLLSIGLFGPPARGATFTWPTNAEPGSLLQYATNLNPTIYWMPLTNEPAVVGDQFQILLPSGGGLDFYRLTK